MYGDKPAALARFRANYTALLSDEMKARVVLENDEMCYNADDLLPVCEELGIPIVVRPVPPRPFFVSGRTDWRPQFDYHHNWIYVRPLPLPPNYH